MNGAAPMQKAPMPSVQHDPIERIAVFRALMLGDLLCAVPALRALRRGFPAAAITLIGLPWARTLAQRLSCVDEFIDFPGHPGLPEIACDSRQWPDFLAQVQSRRFDLALQMHGSGEVVNPLVSLFGARYTAGFARPGVWRAPADEALYCTWPEQGHEIERMLALTDHLGVPRQGTQLEFPLTEADRQQMRQAWPDVDTARPYVCVHAGAQLPSRRWDPRRFAEVADRIADRGRTVVLTGAEPEAGLVRDVQACMSKPAVNLCGRTTLWTLGALIESAEAVVCNDTGVSHVAAALKRPSVVISCGADTDRWSPLDQVLHQVLAAPLPCRPCAWRECPLEKHDCADAITTAQVMQHVERWLVPQTRAAL
jgi:ADP-heptose:LPS heptosyltransferase